MEPVEHPPPRVLGPRRIGTDRYAFGLWAPRAGSVELLFPASGRPPLEMRRSPGGHFSIEARATDGADYAFRIDGGRVRPDPASRRQPFGVEGPSRVFDASALRWTDDGWSGPELEDLILYELHTGTFSPEGTFDGISKRLAHLKRLGVNAIEMMPIAQFPGGRNWGYDGVLPFAAQESYGGPRQLHKLVDSAHAQGLAIILDVVYNHLGPEGNYLDELGPYFTDRYKTPWGKAINFDSEDSDDVREIFLENARYWLEDMRIDGLRLDAVHQIFDLGAVHILAEIARCAREVEARTGRRKIVIAESDLNDPRLLISPEAGGYGLDMQWSDDFHHACHAYLTNERAGYYQDFGSLECVARSLREGFVYAGGYSGYRRRRHGAPLAGIEKRRLLSYTQNHDQVGNRAGGERLSTLVSAARYRLAACLNLISPFTPMLFMGEEYGEERPFLYFVSHSSPALLKAVREGRAAEFRHFRRSADPPDPASEETFLRSKLSLDESREDCPVLTLYRELIELRRRELTGRSRLSSVTFDEEAGWLVMDHATAAGRLAVLFNFGSSRVRVPAETRRRPELLLFTGEARFGGVATDAPARSAGAVEMPPESAAVFRLSSP